MKEFQILKDLVNINTINDCKNKEFIDILNKNDIIFLEWYYEKNVFYNSSSHNMHLWKINNIE